MKVDFFGNDVRCETEGLVVCVNDLFLAGNNWRAKNNLPLKRIPDVIGTKTFTSVVEALCSLKNLSQEDVFYVVGKGRNARTMVHVVLAVYIAEQLSPVFHVKVIDTFVNSKLLEFRNYGSDEFKALNFAIDQYLPGREGKESNKGIYINIAKKIRDRILGQGSKTEDWNSASTDQTHLRYDYEKRLVDMLRLGVVDNYEHLKELIDKL